MTVGYVPVVRARHGAGTREKERVRDLRSRLLQRCIAVLTDNFAEASASGRDLQLDGKDYLAVPRITLYVADMPEQRHLLGLRISRCYRPCSHCMAGKDVCGVCTETTRRSVRETLTLQLEAALLFDNNTGAARRKQISDDHSATPFVPALGAIHGLSTGAAGLYRVFGFDVLHVRCLCASVLFFAGLVCLCLVGFPVHRPFFLRWRLVLESDTLCARPHEPPSCTCST